MSTKKKLRLEYENSSVDVAIIVMYDVMFSHC